VGDDSGEGGVQEEEEKDDGEEECGVCGEEAREVKPARDPRAPTEAERKAHEATHLPFRIWCGPCVRARLPNPPHKRVEREESGVPEVAMDYGFMSREKDKKQMTILVTKDRDTKVVMANVVLHKGAGLEETVDQAVKSIARLGHHGRIGLKVDNEAALLDLRNAVMRKREQPTVPLQPPKGESQSNGAIENAVRLVKEMIRVYLLALEAKIDGTIPTQHPLMCWIAEHAGDMITKHMVGKDGKTGYERLLGKPCRDEGVEFGECIWFKRRKGRLADLEARWQEGVWLGKRWGTIDHLVWTGEAVVEARAIQRKPEPERWSREEVEGITALPWKWKIPDHGHRQVEVIPPRTEQEKAEDASVAPRPEEPVQPKSVYITPQDLDKYGWTKGCRRCGLMRERKKAQGIRHSPECRTRVEERMREERDQRLTRAEERKNEYVAEAMVESLPEHERRGGEGGAQAPASSSSSSSSSSTSNLPAGEAVTVEEGDAMQTDAMQVMLGSLLRSNKHIEKVDKELPVAMGLYELLLTSGMDNQEAIGKIAEIYSPSRVGAAAKKLGFNLGENKAFDLIEDENGRSWNFTRRDHRDKVRKIIQQMQPYVVIGSPPCTEWTRLNRNINHPRMHPEEVRRRMWEARVHMEFVAQIYKDQLRAGRHFLHEHPASADSWKEPQMRWLGGRPEVESIVSHMCRFGMTARDRDGEVNLVYKPTRWLSSAPEILKKLAKRCPGTHPHTKLEGSRRTKEAAIYPIELCRAILQGIIAQRKVEGEVIPKEVLAAVEAGRGVYDCAKNEDERKIEELRMRRRRREVGAVEVQNEELRDWEGERFWESEEETGRGGRYIDDVTGSTLPRKETIAARKEEIEFLDDWHVWELAPIAEAHERTGKGPLGGRWVDHNKGDEASPLIRSRYVAQEIARYKDESLFAATPPLEALRMLISDVATFRPVEYKILMIDVRKAHLHAEAVREVYVHLPPEIRKPGMCARLKRCLYGTRDAASRWEALYTRRLEEMGFARGKASACVFYNKELDSRCVVHGDDFTFSGTDRALNIIEEAMKKVFLCKVEGRLGSGQKDLKEARVLNRVIRFTKGGYRYEADPRHAEVLWRDLGIGGEKPLSSPGAKPKEGKVEEEELSEEETRKYRGGAARANYLAQDRADIAYAAKECCRRMSKPRKCDMEALRRIGKYLLGKPRVVYEFPWQAPEDIRTYVDTDFAGCAATCRSTSGGVAMRGQHLIKHWSCTQKTVTLSSGEAELAGLVKGAAEGLGLVSLAADMGIEAQLTVLADSSAAIGICRRTGIGRVRHLAVGQLWVQERIREKDFALEKFPGAINPADMLTKHLDQQTIAKHSGNAGLKNEEGRPKSAPMVA